MEEVIKLNAVDQYNKMFGLETLHPLVSVVDLSEATGYPRHFTLNYGVYTPFSSKIPNAEIYAMEDSFTITRKAR